jgi:sigma-B regulation protein RsbU (phosphoserine phosphatase)
VDRRPSSESAEPLDAARELRALRKADADAAAFLIRLSEEVNSTLELDEVFRKVADRLRPHIDFDAFGILLLDPLGQELAMAFAVGHSSDVARHWRFGLGQGLVGTVAQTGQPIVCGDVTADERYIGALGGVRSELAVPLTHKKRVIGVIDIQSKKQDRFTDTHRRALTFMAGHIANAIENARLYENLREQARALSLLHEAARELTAILDTEALLRRIAELVKRLADYQHFSVMLWNDETRQLDHAFSLRYDERMKYKNGIPLGYGLCGTAAALRQPIRVANVDLDPRYVSCGHGVPVRSELVVPLLVKDRLIGLVDLESTEYNAFSEQHELILSTLAAHIAVALENARLYEKVRENEQQLGEDLDTAREIQKGLLPHAAPFVPGLQIASAYCPARQLGGDFYDFLHYPDGRLAVAVGDVAGKGAAAALQGSLAVGIWRGHVVEHPCEPAEMLSHLNPHLVQPRLSNRFVALVFGLYDPRSHTLKIANAGFPRPHLVRDGSVEEIQVSGIPLGMLDDSSYHEEEVVLRPGDLVVFGSDGLQESVSGEGEEFGRRMMAATLRKLAAGTAQEIADGLLLATDRFVRDRERHADDRTVVVLKVGAS